MPVSTKVKLVIFLGVVVAAVSAVLFWLRENDKPGEFVVVERGSLFKEIFATGKVRPVEELRLSFRTGGLISAIFTREGQEVFRGQKLAELDDQELQSQMKEALARLALQESNLALADVQLQNSKDALWIRVKDSYDKMEDVLARAEPLFSGGVFGVTLQEGSVTYTFNTPNFELRHRLNTEKTALAVLLPQWKQTIGWDDYFDQAKLTLERLERLRAFVDDLTLAVSHFSTDKTTLQVLLDGYRTSILTAKSSIGPAIINLDLSIQTYVLAQSNVSEAEARVEQVKTEIETLRTKISQTKLVSPVSGTLLSSLGRVGEVVQSGTPIFTLIPLAPFRVEVEIYEGDIGAIFPGQKARVEFIAFKDEFFEGEVIEIDRAPVVLEGIVHYLVTLQILDPPDVLLPNMSADVRFSLLRKEGTLLLPEEAIERKNGRQFARVLVDNQIQERELRLGIRGDGRVVEILEGLQEGEKVFLLREDD